jgi:hypothetical protein
MYKLLKLLGILAVVASSMGHASATTLLEDFVFSYSTNSSFTLANLSYSSSSPPGPNLLTGLAPYTTFGGSIAAGSGSLSEIISVDTTKSYVSNYSVSNFTGDTSRFSITVSAVPLPASFPLFVMALLGLGLIGYHTARTNHRVAV